MLPAVIIFLIATSFTIITAISVWCLSTDLIFLLMFLSIYVLNFGVILQFSFLALSCRDRLKLLNDKISLKFQPTAYEIIVSVDRFKEVIKIMHKINDIAQSLILIFAYLLIITTINVYSVTKLPTYLKETIKDYLLIFQTFSWTLVAISNKLIAIYSAQSSINEAEIFLKLVKDILWEQRITDKIIRKKVEFFLSSIDREEIKFKTIFFSIDWNLVFQVRSKEFEA